MIYGQYAKQYTNNKNEFSIVSESDAILNYLFKEQAQYKNLLLNESFLDNDEKLVMEAKYQVLQEAVTGIIITAVITVLGILSALLVKFMSMLSNGSKQVDEHSKKIADNIGKEKSNSNQSSNNTDNKTNNNQSSSGPIFGTKAKDDKDRRAEMIKIKKEYRNKVDNLIARIKYDFKNGNIDTQSSWFKIMLPKLEAEFKPLVQSDKFHGFSDFNYLDVVDTKAVRKFNDDVRAASTDRDTSNIRLGLINSTGSNVGLVGYNGNEKMSLSEKLKDIVSSPYSILNDTFAKSISNIQATNTYEVLMLHFNSIADDSIEYAAETTKRFQKEGIISKSEKAIKNMNDDIKVLKSTLERLKKSNFNEDDIAASKVTIPNQADDQDKYDRALERQQRNIETADQNRVTFIRNMLYVERESVTMFTNFTKGWGELEKYRLMYIKNFNQVFGSHVEKAVTKSLYNEFKMKYGDSFTEDDPFPEYN